MSVQATGMVRNGRYGTSVRDVIIAKAIQNGSNPFCTSTDTDAKNINEEMREKANRIVVPENKSMAPVRKNSAVREVTVLAKPEQRARREVVHIENFELVKRRTPSLSLGMLVSFMVTAMVLSMVVFSGSLINEEARRYSELSDTLAELKETDKTLTLALEEKHELVDAMDIAVNELGMVAVNATATEYISLSDGDGVEVYDADEEKTSFTVNLLNTFSDKIGGFLEYLD